MHSIRLCACELLKMEIYKSMHIISDFPGYPGIEEPVLKSGTGS